MLTDRPATVVDFTPDPNEHVTHRARFRSRSDSTLVHRTRRLTGGTVACSCRGFDAHGHCWHSDALELLTRDDLVLDVVDVGAVDDRRGRVARMGQ